jgi:hypothetical protein
MRIGFFLIVACFLSTAAMAQQYLYLKKPGTTQLKRLSIGDSIGFSLSDERGHFTEGRIRSIGTDGLVFDFGTYSLLEIRQIRTYSMELYYLSRAMNRGSIALVVLMVANGLIDGGVLIFPGVLIGSAAVYGASFAVKHWSRKVHSFNNGWRYEIIDFSTLESQ